MPSRCAVARVRRVGQAARDHRRAARGVKLDSHSKMPDVVLHDVRRKLCESVTNGPVDRKRHAELATLFDTVTAFPSRQVMGRFSGGDGHGSGHDEDDVLDVRGAMLLLKLGRGAVYDGHGHVSTAVTSNIALSDWGRYLGDATLTAAILDRLAMHAIRIDIDGPSWRHHVAKHRAAERAGGLTEKRGR